MAEEGTTTFHVHRRYNMKPLRRYAFTVEFDVTADAGYKIVEHDPIVADVSYLAKFDSHMAQPARDCRSGAVYKGVEATFVSDYAPGSLGHFTNAVRSFGAALMPTGRTR